MGTEKEKDMTNEDLVRLYEDSVADIKEGELLKGRIVHIGEKEILVDVGYKSEGVIYKSEISDPGELKVGGEIDVILESKENDMGMVVLSHEKAKRFRGWQNILENHDEGDLLEGKVFRKVRGGFMVDVGMEAFLPASLSMMQEFGGADNILGRWLQFKIVKINIPRKNIVLSRKELVEEQRREEKQAILEGLSKGDLVKGVVRNITDFGAFVDIGGGITGLLHITDMSWGRVNHPSEVVKIGDEIEVEVLDFDKVSIKVSLGLKQRTTNPWEDIEVKYPEGSVISGKVVNIMPYGVFVELEKGIEGLIHISELSWSKKYNHPSEMFKTGDDVKAIVLKTDKKNQKLSLGIKQLEKDPWDGVEERYSVGDRIKGMINAVTDYGAFIELEKGVEGLIHVSDLSWTKRITHPKEILKKGEEVEAIILNVDEQNRRIALGVKQLTQDPWDEITNRYGPDTVCEGKVTNITNFGIFVELESDLEGLLHISEIDLEPQQRMEDLFRAGDPVKVKIIHIDGVQKKIALSTKGLEQPPKPERQAGTEEQKGETPAAEAQAPEDALEAEEKPLEEKPLEEKPLEEKPLEEKPSEETPSEEKPSEEKPSEEKPLEEKPAETEDAREGISDEEPEV
ncbi:MAG: 30S ribosomal protein S1 [Candidatus Omnitrophota bacterium]|nr:30S ribosomal protein S1 [Candidatus Omnitrophota bacterium]